jgi:Zn-dependent protease with chaperone function
MLQAAVHAVYTLPPDKLAQAIALARARNLAYFAGTAWLILILWVLVRLRAGAAIRDVAARVSRRPWIQGLIVVPIWGLIVTALNLPLDFLMQHVNRGYGLSVESWMRWLFDYGKSTALSLIVGTALVSVLYFLIRRSPRRWWLWFWILSLPFEVAAAFVIPVVIDPMFDHFTPLAQSDPALVQQLERVAARGHLQIPPTRMYVMDASAKVTGPNAYVTGFGPSKRIVVWDTAIHEMSPDQILAVYGHEQGHYVLHHIQKGMLFSAVVTFVFFWIGAALLEWLVRRYGGKLRIPALGDWSSVGLLLLVIMVLGFFAEPIGNAFSRHIEHQADVYGEEVIHGLVPNAPATMAASFQRLGELWLDVPHPNPFIVFWTYSHPPTASRMRFAASYDPWQPGKHPRYVSR